MVERMEGVNSRTHSMQDQRNMDVPPDWPPCPPVEVPGNDRQDCADQETLHKRIRELCPAAHQQRDAYPVEHTVLPVEESLWLQAALSVQTTSF